MSHKRTLEEWLVKFGEKEAKAKKDNRIIARLNEARGYDEDVSADELIERAGMKKKDIVIRARQIMSERPDFLQGGFQLQKRWVPKRPDNKER